MLEEREFLHRQQEIIGRAENSRGAGRRGHGSRQPIARCLMWIAALAALMLLLILMSQSASAQTAAGADESAERAAITQGAGGEIPPPTAGEKKRPVGVTRFEQPPAIDGQLDESVWQRAAVLKDFYQTEPGDNAAPTHATEVRIGYDSKFLYVGIRALDERGEVRATVAKRDDLSGNDYTAIWLDTFDDRRKAYVLLFNPLGVQADGVFTEGQGIDYSVDLVMESRGIVSDEGYTVEVAIPFTSLRYEAGEGKLWGVHVLRRVRHLDEWDTWMPLRRESRDFNSSTFTQFLQQSGHITGIVDVGRERTLELIPTLTLSETGRRVRALAPSPATLATLDRGRFVNAPLRADPGLTAKVTLSSGVTLAAAINPDFAQVEADQLVVTANQRFPIFFEEKRPFFLEGVEIFQTPVRVVHTRTIVDPDWALKLAGKRNRNSFGLLVASDKAPGNFSDEERQDPVIRPGIERFLDRNAHVGVLRLKRDVGSQSSVGLIATSYDF
ncbi:MAG: carbohydrate binding family 9 domain-containing protein, partial [Rubrivivax sp.]|nr:carbohydrate binding family 9 domain-containing protein [Pyrinomonadaceae bacterium]